MPVSLCWFLLLHLNLSVISVHCPAGPPLVLFSAHVHADKRKVKSWCRMCYSRGSRVWFGGGDCRGNFERNKEFKNEIDVSKLVIIFTQLSYSQNWRGKRGYMNVQKSNYLKKLNESEPRLFIVHWFLIEVFWNFASRDFYIVFSVWTDIVYWCKTLQCLQILFSSH